MSRGGVWYFLAEQACLRSAPPDTAACPLYHTPYTALLGGLTKHQHAILIDLGKCKKSYNMTDLKLTRVCMGSETIFFLTLPLLFSG